MDNRTVVNPKTKRTVSENGNLTGAQAPQSAVAIDLPDTVPHDFDAELQADAHRLDRTYRGLFKRITSLDKEAQEERAAFAARKNKALLDEDLLSKQEMSNGQRTVADANKEVQNAERALQRGRPHPILREVSTHVSLATAMISPSEMANPVDTFNRTSAALKEHVRDSLFYSYEPASFGLRFMFTALVAGPLSLIAYWICRDTSLYPGAFWGLVVWSVIAGLLLSLRFVRGNAERYGERYRTLVELHSKIKALWPAVEQHLLQRHDARLAGLTSQYAAEEVALNAVFGERYAELRREWDAYIAESDELCPPFTSEQMRTTWLVPEKEWRPAEELPRAVRLGDQLLRVNTETINPPLLVPFPGGVSLLFETSGEAKARALEGVQAVMLRLLASIPPGKLRYVLIDPVGLGQNVAPFMPLADFDEKLITARAWTEPNHIEQRLTDLSEHMELVIQKYLQNKFASMEDYNKQAEMVEEPYRVLVVANFPVNFTESAAKRLVSIATNGPRCGVYTLITCDTEQPMPHGFNVGDLERASTCISSDRGAFWLHDPEIGNVSLRLDAPPKPDKAIDNGDNLFNRIVSYVGSAAKRQAGVKVPYRRIEPKRNEWWTADSRDRIVAPIGIMGASGRQELDLGAGTRQHALMAGRTGSGKSTLLHILITTLALKYSPEELELYLIDFKKGVEFKTYAANELPHARVIAIESEREFGLSVLEGLDRELTERGNLFRRTASELGTDIQNISVYRTKTKEFQGVKRTLPRILLIVDEFQEFFSEDDQIANKIAQILDRLVRQGRGFGIHVILGSQTLAGTYTLGRGTIDQMGIRIALQCSEADSRLILSEDNPAARLLSRPGEAIYNHENGKLEGNNRFQTVWLEDAERDALLGAIRKLRESHPAPPDRPAIKTRVFEGQQLAKIEDCDSLTALTAESDWPATPPRVPVAWLGEAVSIKPPTAAQFRRQAGCNLIVVGQDEEAALGISASVLLSMAAQYAPSRVRVVLADLSLEDGPFHDRLNAVASASAHRIEFISRRRLGEAVEELAAEVKRRIAADEHAATPIFFMVHGLMRARDLRISDDPGRSAFSFGSSYDLEAEPPAQPKANPAELLPRILRDGPEVGIHTIVWSDTLNNAQRVLDRGAMREFDLRVAFQMSSDDANSLIDSPAASRLGTHRAYFYSEERGLLEKFRPYAPPDPAALAAFGRALTARQMPNVAIG